MEENNYYSICQLLKMIEEFNNILIEMSKRHISDKKALKELLVYDNIKNKYNLRRKAMKNLEKSIEKFC